MLKKFSLSWFLKLLFTVVLLGLVLYQAELTTKSGWSTFLAVLDNADIFVLSIAMLFIPAMDMVSTVKWYYLCKAKNLLATYFQLLLYYMTGRFFNLILPSNIGGDIIRIHLLGRFSKRSADAAGTVVLERLTGLVVLVLYTIIVLLITSTNVNEIWLQCLVVLAAVSLLAVVWVVFEKRLLKGIEALFGTKYALLNKLFSKLDKLHDSMGDLAKSPKVLFIAFFNSLLFYGAAVLNAWVSLLVFNQEVSLETMLVAVPIIMFIMNIPISIGNIGIMEFSYIFVLTKVGVSPAEALSLAIFMRMKNFLAGLLGGAIYMLVPVHDEIQHVVEEGMDRFKNEN